MLQSDSNIIISSRNNLQFLRRISKPIGKTQYPAWNSLHRSRRRSNKYSVYTVIPEWPCIIWLRTAAIGSRPVNVSLSESQGWRDEWKSRIQCIWAQTSIYFPTGDHVNVIILVLFANQWSGCRCHITHCLMSHHETIYKYCRVFAKS